ncbi:Bromodomain-containing protein [Apiospora hydei]|uniref:Bromodomain-containing protein n=1 Tax=Apiospora hydei TaxID=1337664 RepID=A0ABR1X8J5_9PEZI
MADQNAKAADNAIEVRESIEAKAAAENEAKDAPEAMDTTQDGPGDQDADGEPDEDADGEADPDADAEGEEDEDAEGEEDDAEGTGTGTSEEPGSRRRGGMSSDMYIIIENTANYLSSYREKDGYQIAQHFQRVPNRRLVPDYYDVIKEGIAFSTIRTKKLKKQYSNFSEFVRDVAQICHNAQVYNRPSSHFFQDAGRLREVFKEELQKLVDDEAITPAEAVLPDLGELPEAEDSPPPEEDEGEEDEDDEDDEDDDDDSDDEGGRRRGRRSRQGRKSDARDEDAHKKRGRPPKVFTPLEARIHALLKGLRKFKHPDGELMILPFEKLPDKQATPEYYTHIKNPIALDAIKKKAKRKKYPNVDAALKDIELMFENAKEYNEEGSQIFQDAVELQKQARVLAEQEKARPDNEFEDEDGRRPLTEIVNRGEVWKPIVAQIYRTWEDKSGQKWVNACWYYRPEQTVHRFEKHFLEHEVVKTGQYRDHRIDEVVDRCFVMFVTRFNKGRPRGLPKDKDVYVCEARYNEEKHRLNKIKTWASCVPDEVREKDYEMDLFDVPEDCERCPHLLRDDAKPTDPLPKPTWGHPNAPPLIGAVHCREREANESPPPEPTPTPPPVAPVEPIRRPSMMQASSSQGDITMGNTPHHFQPVAAPPTPTPVNPAYAAPHFAPRPSASPVPVPQYGHPGMHNAHAAPQMPPQTPHYQHPPPQPAFNNYQYAANGTPMPHQPHQPHHQPHHQPMPMNASPMVGYDQRLAPSPARPAASGKRLQPPRPVEVYRLDDSLNERIPAEIRDQFQRDEAGRVLFFTQPPLERAHRGVSHESAGLGHSVRYLADRARGIEDRRAKRKARDELRKEEERKKAETAAEQKKLEMQEQIDVAADVLNKWIGTMNKENEALKQQYDGWSVRDEDIDAYGR